MFLLFFTPYAFTEKIMKAVEYTPLTKKVYDVINLYKATAMGVARITDICGPPQIKYPSLCGLWISTVILLIKYKLFSSF